MSKRKASQHDMRGYQNPKLKRKKVQHHGLKQDLIWDWDLEIPKRQQQKKATPKRRQSQQQQINKTTPKRQQIIRGTPLQRKFIQSLKQRNQKRKQYYANLQQDMIDDDDFQTALFMNKLQVK